MGLSLANNFVTELTSLVVVDKQDVKIASLGPGVEKSSSFGGVSYSGGISAQSFGISRSVGGGRRGNTYRKSNRGRISHSYSSSGGRSSSRSVSYSLSNSPGVVTHSLSNHAQVQSAPMYFDAYNKFESNPATTTTTYSPLQTSCSGSVTLFTKTYNRGTNITISQDTSDLGTFKLVSLKVTGDCSWEIFTGTNYSGKSKQFTSSGSYLSTTSMGTVFRNAGSVKRC